MLLKLPPPSDNAARNQPAETRLSIQGQFLNRHRGEEDEFVFQDTENTTIVVFDNSNGRDIRLNEVLVIEGEIDKGLLKTEFNLHQVKPAN